MKLCGIAWRGELSQAELIAAATKIARAQLVKEKRGQEGSVEGGRVTSNHGSNEKGA